MIQLMILATVLQDLFTTTADLLARLTGFIKRPNKLTGSAVAQTLVFRWLANPKDTLENIAGALGVSPQALQQHCPQAVPFFKALIAEALKRLFQFQAKATKMGLLDAFDAVVLDDATTVKLPADLVKLFPGCGGNCSAGDAALKILLRYELKSGRILAMTFHPGKTSDTTLAAQAEDLPRGTLYLADMGFFDAARLKLFHAAGQHWITRIQCKTRVKIGEKWQSQLEWLSDQTADVVDVAEAAIVASVGTPCRLVALRCPEEVTNRRRQKLRESSSKRQRTASALSLALCAWTIFATSVEAKVLSARAVWLAYRCRWQIELLFKRAKQQCGWEFSHGKEGNRVLVELLAKILGLVVIHWVALSRGGPLSGVSVKKVLTKVVEFARQLGASLSKGLDRVVEVLEAMLKELERLRPQRPRIAKPSTRDLLFNPALAA